MRLRRKAGTMDALHQITNHFEDNPMNWRGRWHERFGNDHPIHLELGIGKGNFFAQMSSKHRDANWIGIDMREELLMLTWQKTEEVWLENNNTTPKDLCLVLINGEMLGELFAKDELSRVYLNFSDPWPKKRHARRRLTHHRFLENYWNVLKFGGEIHFKTDAETLFEFSLNEFEASSFTMKNISLNLHREGNPEWNIMTEYESKFVSKGQPIFRLEAIKDLDDVFSYNGE